MWYGQVLECQVPRSGGQPGVGWNLGGGCVPEVPIIIDYGFPPGSSVVKVWHLFQQARVFILLLYEFLRFAEQVCDPLQHGRVWASVFALTKGRVYRRGRYLSSEHRVLCILVLLFPPLGL